ncbi:GSCOCG00007819001-RA-CDS [Cotesia congregata]|nr:GSCOCG00007819001-RA-CDS [Cotesia congregata]
MLPVSDLGIILLSTSLMISAHGSPSYGASDGNRGRK